MKYNVKWIIDEVMWSIRNDQDFKGQLTLMELAIERTVDRCASIADKCCDEGLRNVGNAIREHFEVKDEQTN